MALRLTTAKTAPESRRPAAQRFSDLALTALRARDLARYAAVFAETAEIEDPQRRYQARTALIERGLEAAQTAAEADYGTLLEARPCDGDVRRLALLERLRVHPRDLG